MVDHDVLMNISMENYKIYISEIKRLELKSEKRFSVLSHFSSIKNRSPEELERLMNCALGDLASLTSGEIKRELKEVEHLVRMFSDIDSNYPDLFRKFQNGNLGIYDLKIKLFPLFRFIRPGPGIITERFIVGLYISILNKQKSILTFKNKIQCLLTAHSSSLSQSVAKL